MIRKERLKANWQKNKEKYNKRKRMQYALNTTKYKNKSHRYYLKNKEIILEKQNQYWSRTKDEKNKERKLQYQNDNDYKQEAIDRAKNYYEKNKTEIIKKRGIYYKKNREKVNEYSTIKYREFKAQIFQILGDKKCVNCGYDNELALQFDHIKGGGKKQRKTGSVQQLRQLIKNPKKTKSEIQILCACCNIIKMKTNPNEFAQNNRTYTTKTKESKRLHNRENHKKWIRQLKEQLFNILGDKKCVNCGYDNELALQFDHKDGGGNQEKKTLASSYQKYKFYVSNPKLARTKLQILCGNCNSIKKFKNKEFGYIKQNQA